MSYETMLEDMDAERLGPESVQELHTTRFVEGLLEGKTGAMAARDAGFGVSMQRTPGKIIAPEELRRRFQEICENRGLTLDKVAAKIAEHLEARANQTLNGKEVTQSKAPDNRVQQKAIEQLTTLIGMQDAAKAQVGGSSISLTITGPAAERLAQVLSGE
jgi:hypothetical protein